MTTQLEQTIQQDGYAQVIAILDSGAAASAEGAGDFARHFLDPAIAGERLAGAVLASADTSHLASEAPTEFRVAAAGSPPSPPVRVYPRLGLALGYVDASGLTGLCASPNVRDVVRAEMPSLIRPVQAQLTQPPAQPTWGVTRIGAPPMWGQGYKGQGVLVGHVDTGVDGNHPALAGAIADFAEFDLNGNEVPGVSPWDSDDHGTHTAGSIVGRSSPNAAFGVAPEAKLLSAMVIEGGNVIARILGGMEWAVEKGVSILSASLGLRGQGAAFQALVDALRQNNVLPVFAVGNEGPGTSRYPGNYHNALSVGACDDQDRVADFSGSQRFLHPSPRIVPDLVAPGVNILSCVPNGRFASMNGTSMAAPHVAGLAALLLSAEPSATADDLEQAIQASCRRPTGMDAQRGGLGIPEASRALALLRSSSLAA